jgi:hypothetical protein
MPLPFFQWPLCLLLISAGMSGLTSVAVWWGMVEDVNQRLPLDQQIDYFFWDFLKHRKVMRMYKAMYPLSRRPFVYYGCALLGWLCLGILAVKSGILR